MPRVSVIMPAFNVAWCVRQAMDSVLSQDFTDLELIVVDDGSADNTAQVIQSHPDSRVRYVHQPNSGGCSSPRNAGLVRARGELIALLDADDQWLPGKLSAAVRVFDQAPHLGLVFTNYALMDAEGRQLPGARHDGYPEFRALEKEHLVDSAYVIRQDVAFRGMFFEHYIGISGVVAPKAVFDRVGPFDESLRNSEDRDMWFRVARLYDIGYLDMVGHLYRVNPLSVSHRGAQLVPAKVEVLRRRLTPDLPGDLRRQVKRLIVRNLSSLALDHQQRAAFPEARRQYAASMRERFSWAALRGWCLTWPAFRRLRTLTRAFGA